MLRLIYYILALKPAERMNAARIERLQDKRFRKLLKHVLTHSKFYKEYYKKAGITLDNYKKVAIRDIPTINKQIMMDNYDDFVCDPNLKHKKLEKFIATHPKTGDKFMNKYHIVHTSGSTGKVGIFVYGPNDWAILMAMAINRVTKTKINIFKKARLAYIGAMGGHYAGISLASSAPKFLFDFLAIDINSPLKEIIKKVNKFKPRTLSGYSSGTYLLAQEQLKGNIDLHLEKILCAGDPLTPHMQEKIIEAFGVEPTNYYASSESICMASHCEKHKDLHMFDDWHVFDFDKENLIMTTLYNYTQPLIRYEMNDAVTLDEKGCDCRWGFPVIKNIAGRSEEFLWFDKKDGSRDFLHPLVLVEFFVEGLDKFQFIQKSSHKLDLHIVAHGDKRKVEEDAIKHINEILKSKDLHNDVKIDVEIVKDIKNDLKTGKFKLIVPLK